MRLQIMEDCLIKCRKGEDGPIRDGGDGRFDVSLRNYAIIPFEEYEELIEWYEGSSGEKWQRSLGDTDE